MMSSGCHGVLTRNSSRADVCAVSSNNDSIVLEPLPVGPAQPQCGPSSQLTDTVTQHPRHQTPRERIPSHPMKCARSRTASHWQTWPQPTTEMTRSTELTSLEMTTRTPIEQWHGIGATAEGSDLTGVTLVHELGTAARDTFRVNTTACSCSVQRKTASAIDIRTESLPLTPYSCPVSLACLVTDSCARLRETLQSLVWAGHGNTEKTSNLNTVQHGQH